MNYKALLSTLKRIVLIWLVACLFPIYILIIDHYLGWQFLCASLLALVFFAWVALDYYITKDNT